MLSKYTDLSLAMIVKDEVGILENSLEALSGLTDEIIIIDHHSTDGTQAIAKRYAQVFEERDWTESFAKARILAEEKCNHQYILTWDADWLMPIDTKQNLLKLKQSHLTEYDLVRITMINEWNIDTGQVYVSELRPIIYNSTKLEWEFAIHNALLPRNKDWKSIRTLDLPELVFYHNKDGGRKWRYDQTLRMGEQTLLDYSPGDWRRSRILFLIAQDYQYAKNYERAIELYTEFLDSYSLNQDTLAIAIEKCAMCYFSLKKIEKVRELLNKFSSLKNHIRYQLVQADLWVLENKLANAKARYLWFLAHENEVRKSLESYDYTRFVLHPKHMLTLLKI